MVLIFALFIIIVCVLLLKVLLTKKVGPAVDDNIRYNEKTINYYANCDFKNLYSFFFYFHTDKIPEITIVNERLNKEICHIKGEKIKFDKNKKEQKFNYGLLECQLFIDEENKTYNLIFDAPLDYKTNYLITVKTKGYENENLDVYFGATVAFSK